MGFIRVKEILDNSLEAWADAKGRRPNLDKHGPGFSWETKKDLLEAVGRGRRLIDPDLIGTQNAEKAVLIIDLRTGFGGFRMPQGGPYLPESEIDEIQQWIADGCPD
ncbi:MAG: hypothetical protein KDK03_03835 [Rhodobacteraceae bacterium]|nr:hypothetical protein [Paracoccaceae bacterium]